MVPFFLDVGHMTYTQIFILQAFFMICVVLLEVPTGVIADKYSRKLSLILAGLFGAAAWIVYGLVTNYYLFFIGEFLCAISLSLVSGADNALVYDTLVELKKKDESKQILSNYESAKTIGIMIALPVGSIIAGSAFIAYPQSISFVLLLTAIPNIISFFIALSLVEPKREKPIEHDFIKQGILGIKYVFTKNKKDLLRISLNNIFISVTTFFIFWFYQPLLTSSNVNISYFGVVAAGYNILGLLLLWNISRLEKTFTMKQILWYSAIIPGIAYIALAFTNNLYLVLIGIYILTAFKLMRRPLLTSYMNHHIESSNRATVLSGISLIERVTVFIFYPIVGLLADLSISYALVFLGVFTLFFALFTKIEDSHLEIPVDKRIWLICQFFNYFL